MEIKDEYSPYKLVHFPRVLGLIKKGILPNPLQAHLIATNRCNQDCVICAYRREGYQSNQCFNPRSELPGSKLMEIISDLAALGTKAIQFTGGGEPLLHPDICQAFLKAKKLGMMISLVTNGTKFNEGVAEAVAGAAWIRFSLDSATQETYAKVKRSSGKIFDQVIRNIENAVKNKGNTILGIGFVVQEYNYREILQAVKLAKNLGVNNIRIAAAFTPLGVGYFNNFLDEAKEQTTLAQEQANNNFTVFNLFNERLSELFSGKQRYSYCHYKDMVPYIGADANVYSCCVKAYTDQGLMGSIKDMSLRDFWEGSARKAAYQNHNPITLCNHACMFEEKNMFINYCVKDKPKHAGFI